MDEKWSFYIIHLDNYTYAGVSPDPIKRLRKHNGEISGGAKYTTAKGKGWEHICIIEGFPTKINSMQFEWAVKHCLNRNEGGIQARIKKLFYILNNDKWTSNSPPANTINLKLIWKKSQFRPINLTLPEYIEEIY